MSSCKSHGKHSVLIYEEPEFEAPGELIHTAFHIYKETTGQVMFEMFSIPENWMHDGNSDIVDIGVIKVSREKLERICRRFVRTHKFYPTQSNNQDWCNDVLEELKREKVASSNNGQYSGYLYKATVASTSESLLPRMRSS